MLSWLDPGRLVLNSRRCNELMLVLTCVPTRSPCILRTFRLCSLPVSVWSTLNPVLPFPYGFVAPSISVSSCMCSSKLTRFPTPIVHASNIYSCINLLSGVAFVVVLNWGDRHSPLPGLRNTKRMSIPPEGEPYQGYE